MGGGKMSGYLSQHTEPFEKEIGEFSNDDFDKRVKELMKKLKTANPTWSEQELRPVAEDMAARSYTPLKETDRPD